MAEQNADYASVLADDNARPNRHPHLAEYNANRPVRAENTGPFGTCPVCQRSEGLPHQKFCHQGFSAHIDSFGAGDGEVSPM